MSMAGRTDEEIIHDVIQTEGGYVDREADHGGATNFGITIPDLYRFRGTPATADDIRNLTRDEAAQIYRRQYITEPKFDLITDNDLRGLVIDCGVLHGVVTAAKWLQGAVGYPIPDGIIGRETISRLAGNDPRRVYLRICAQRVRYMGSIVTNDYLSALKGGFIKQPLQAEFAHGWLNRVADYIEMG